MLLKEVTFAHKDRIFLIKYTTKTVIFWNIILSSLQYHMILQKIFLICWFGAQKTFLCLIFLWKLTLFSGFFDQWKIQKNSMYLKCIWRLKKNKHLKAFNITFDKFNACLLNKCITFPLKKQLLLNSSVALKVKTLGQGCGFWMISRV